MSSNYKNEDIQARLDSLKAFIAERNEGATGALDILKGNDDPIRFRARLSTLIRHKEFSEAFELIKDKVLHEAWGEFSVYVCVASGNPELAIQKIESAKAMLEPETIDKFRLGFVDAILTEKCHSKLNPKHADFGLLDDVQRQLLESAAELLWPVAQKVRINGAVTSKIQEHVINALATCLSLLGRLPEISSLITPLLNYRPIPLVLGQLALSGAMAEIPSDLVERIRTEHPRNFEAQLQSAICEYELLRKNSAAFHTMVRIKDEFPDLQDEEKVKYCQLLFEIASRENGQLASDARQVTDSFLGTPNEFGLYYDTLAQISLGKYREAISRLDNEQREEDSLWWQIRSSCYWYLGEHADAAEAMARACKLMPHPSLLNEYAWLSLRCNDRSSAISALEKALEKTPNDPEALYRLATTYVAVRDHRNAADKFKRLAEVDSGNELHKLNYAICLARSNQLENAIKALDSIKEPESQSLRTVLTRSYVLNSVDQPDAAMEIFREYKKKFWDNPEFVASYMDTSYRSGNDPEASAAMTRLLELQETNKSGVTWLHPHSIDELIEFGSQRRKSMDQLSEMIATGKMPWLYADAMFGYPAMKSWYFRTATVDWLSEERNVRGQNTVYSTNGFAILSPKNGVSTIEPIDVADEQSSCVVDLSALLTLFKLDRLKEFVDYFAKIYIPGSIEELGMDEGKTITHPQPSRERELKAIRQFIDNGKIKIANGDSSQPVVDEYGDNQESTFSLLDLQRLLEASSQFTTENLNELSKIATREKRADDFILGNTSLQIELMTLGTLTRLGWISRLVDALSLTISSKDYSRLVSELGGHVNIHEIASDHDVFWKWLGSMSDKISALPVYIDTEIEDDFRTIPHLDAAIVSVENDLPLVADDRVCQQYRLAEASSGQVAFGTDKVLAALWRTNRITLKQATNDFLKLIKWRYRFLTPEPDYLKNLADRSRSNLPGPDLSYVATYLHDCMQDPGLFCGLEKTDPPMPLGFKQQYRWISNVIQFVTMIVDDCEYEDETFETIVRWTIKSLIPSIPNYLLHHQIGKNMAAAMSKTIVQLSLSSLIAIESLERANLAIKTIWESLPITESEFLLYASEAASERAI